MTQQLPKFLTAPEVLLIHQDLIAKYGGSLGILDFGRLESALSQPQQQFGGILLHQDLPTQTAAYLFYLAKAHAFVDGNKRVAATCANVFVRTNGLRLNCAEEEFYSLTLGIADGSISKEQAVQFFQLHIS